MCVGEERLVEDVGSCEALIQKVQRILERLSFFGEDDVEEMLQGEMVGGEMVGGDAERVVQSEDGQVGVWGGGDRLWSRGETGKRKMIRVTYQRAHIPSRLDPEAAVPLHSGFEFQCTTCSFQV